MKPHDSSNTALVLVVFVLQLLLTRAKKKAMQGQDVALIRGQMNLIRPLAYIASANLYAYKKNLEKGRLITQLHDCTYTTTLLIRFLPPVIICLFHQLIIDIRQVLTVQLCSRKLLLEWDEVDWNGVSG